MPRLPASRSARLAAVAAAALLPVSLRAEPAGRGADSVGFQRDVRPILSENCFPCHGPDEEARRADLRLDRPGPARRVLSGESAEEIELLYRITAEDRGDRMPPRRSNLELTPQEVEVLRRWVLAGAPYARHWSFVPLPRHVPVPEVEDRTWPRGAIDRFVLARLEAEGLSPAPEARRELWLRRLSFALTGLPPALEELDAFLADDTPGAHGRAADRLLARPAYGERQAAQWLDVARYSDTYGYQVDRDRFVWPWRDWVIDAFNENLPYDDFVTWQLAGDLLPDATDEQVLATTFQRLHPQKVEGGSVPEEFRVEYVADRNHTFATGLLGLTLECARCHDHKYDPIEQEEYYELFAFFNNIDEAGLYSYFTRSVPTPTLLLAGEDTEAEIDRLEERVRTAEEEVGALASRRRPAFARWLEDRPEEPAVPGEVAHLGFEERDLGANRRVPGRVGRAVRLTGDDGVGLEVGNFRRFQPFSVALWMRTPDVKERAVVYHRSRAWTDAGSRGYELLIEDGRLSAALVHFWPGNAVRVRTRERIPPGEWVHVAVTWDGSSRAGGLAVYVDGVRAPCDVVRDKLTKRITGGGGDHITIGARFRDRGFTGGEVDEFRVFERELGPLEIDRLRGGSRLETLLSRPAGDLSSRDREALFDYWAAAVDPEHRRARVALRDRREELAKTLDGVREIMVMRELPERRPTHLLRRGAYDAPGKRVRPGTPDSLPPFPEDAPRNRLGLARWLTQPDHPLTARVAADRLWRLAFGRGLVRTPEDFGSQGEPPTHPALLDWLARELVDSGWDMKRLLRKIVTSATYRQSSRVDRETIQRDPANRRLARGPSHRLSAEMVRDNALAVSGLLVREIGGPPARPYEVAESFKPVEADTGEGLWRRSLYTYWKRTGPAPVMMTLDASKREVCRVRRERTSTPLQALVLLDGPQFVEAARGLAERLVRRHGADDGALVEVAFRIATSRRPAPAEARVLRRLLDEEQAHFEEHPEAAGELLDVGEAPRAEGLPRPRVAAATLLANALLNHHDAVTKP